MADDVVFLAPCCADCHLPLGPAVEVRRLPAGSVSMVAITIRHSEVIAHVQETGHHEVTLEAIELPELH